MNISVWCSLVALTALIVAAVFVSGALPGYVSSQPASNEATASVTPAVAVGLEHAVGLRADGTVATVGRDSDGQCNADNWTDIVQVAAGDYHTVGLRANGTAVAVGDNDFGQCNVDNWTDIVQVAAGDYHTVGLKANGTVVVVGDNSNGERNVGGWTNIVQIAAGSVHTVGLKDDGTVVAAGASYSTDGVDAWTGVVQVAAGAGHTVGLKSGGTVVAVGMSFYGQCNVGSWTSIEQVATGAYHTLGLKTDGTVVAVGRNDWGQCDVGSWTDTVQIAGGGSNTVGLRSDWTVVAVGLSLAQCNVSAWTDLLMVAAGTLHTVGLKSDGTVVAVGSSADGRCDVGGWTSIAQIAAGAGQTVGLKSDGTLVAVGWNNNGQCNVGGWTGIVQVATSETHTVGLKSDGAVVAVGDNSFGQCNVGAWTGVVQVTAGSGHTVGLKSDGTVLAAGKNNYGQCNVGGWTGIVQVAAGGGHTVGLKSDGTLVAVGSDYNGQCDVGGWTGIAQIAAGLDQTVGVKSDGTVMAIGWNYYGQCDVGAWTRITQVATYGNHTVGLRSTGIAIATGDRSSGQCNLGLMLKTPVEVTGITAIDKAYDGTVTATLNSAGATLLDVRTADNVTLMTLGVTGVFADKNAGAGKSVTVSGLTLSGSDAGYYHLLRPMATAAITPRSLTVTGITANGKKYDGNTTAGLNASGAALVGVIPGDNVTLVTSGGIGAFADKNVGAGKAVSVSGLTLSGPDAGNYFLVQPAATADVTQRPLLVTATGINKTYDGAASASVTLSDDTVSGDSLTVSSVAAFADKHVGSNKTVNVSGISISGPDAGNYSLSSTTATTTGSILPRSLAITGITAADKVYDGYAGASLNTSSAALMGVLSGDDVTLVTSDVVGSFPDKNAGTGKTVTVSGITLSGSDAGNYSLSQITITASILVKPLMVKDIIADSKMHDGTSAATLDFSSANLLGLVSGDDVTLVTSGATGVFEDEAVGNGKTVTVSGLTLSGSDAGNYSLAGYTTAADIYQPTADIDPAGGANWGLIAAIAAAAVAVAGMAGWLVLRRRNK